MESAIGTIIQRGKVKLRVLTNGAYGERIVKITEYLDIPCVVHNKKFYQLLKEKGFVIYPGKLTGLDAFRIGNIGHVFPEDMLRLLTVIKESIFW